MELLIAGLPILTVSLLVPLIIRWHIRSGRIKTSKPARSQPEVRRTRLKDGLVRMIVFLTVIVPVILAALLVVSALQRDWLVNILRRILSPEAIFFNPAPGLYLVALGLFGIAMFGGLALVPSLGRRFPARFQNYMTAMTPADLRWDEKFASGLLMKMRSVLCLGSALLIAGSLPLHRSSDGQTVDVISRYPLHKKLPLSDVESIQVTCKYYIEHDGGKRYAQYGVDMTAQTTERNYTLISRSDAPLPLNGVEAGDIAALYDSALKAGVTLNIKENPDCAYGIERTDSAEKRAQYNALFQLQ